MYDDRPTLSAIADVLEERARQENLVLSGAFTSTCASPDMTDGHKLAVLTEEVGEVGTAILGRAKLAADASDNLRAELVQVAAVAVAWIESLDAAASTSLAASPRSTAAQEIDRLDAVAEAARATAASGIDDADSRLPYVTAQVSRADWQALHDALRALDGGDPA